MRNETIDFISTGTTAGDFMLSVPDGDITGYSSVNKFGRNPDIDNNSDPEDIWAEGGLWVPPTAARIHDIASSSVEDAGSVLSSGTATTWTETVLTDTSATFVSDGVTVGDVILNDTVVDHSVVSAVTETTITSTHSHHGAIGVNGGAYRIVTATATGASIVHLSGLDEDMKERDEFVVLNGTTNVPTIRTYWRIYRAHTDGAASRTVTNVGDIRGTAQTDGTVTFKMGAGFGTTLLAIYTVPAGKVAYMTQFYASINKQGGTSGAMADLTLRITPFATTDGLGSRIDHYFGVAVDGTSNYVHEYKPYKRIEEQTDIWIRCDQVTDNNTDISAGFDLILVDKV